MDHYSFFRKWNQQICLYPRNQPIHTNLQSVTNTRIIINRINRGSERKKKICQVRVITMIKFMNKTMKERKNLLWMIQTFFLPHCNTTDNASRLWFTLRLRVNWIQFVTLESLIENSISVLANAPVSSYSFIFNFFFFFFFVIFWMCHGIKSIAISVFLSFEFEILNAMLFANFQLFYFKHKHNHTHTHSVTKQKYFVKWLLHGMFLKAHTERKWSNSTLSFTWNICMAPISCEKTRFYKRISGRKRGFLEHCKPCFWFIFSWLFFCSFNIQGNQ